METLKTVSLADQIFQVLEQNILDGTYPRDAVFTETQLSNMLGVSRTPIREAIRRLQQANIVKASGKGIVIGGVDLQDMYDIYDIRMRIEGLAASWAAMRINDDGISALKEALDLEEFYTQHHDPDHLKLVDTQFHEIIYRCCGSEMLESMLTDLHRRIQVYRKLSLQDSNRANTAFAEHKKIFEAIKNHDAAAAEALVSQHILNARNSIDNKERKPN